MSAAPWHYTKGDLVGALGMCGVGLGDVVFVHVSLGRLGYPDRGPNVESASAVLAEALLESVGAGGTLLVPTYSYSIGRGEPFDPATTPGTIGPFSEWFRQHVAVVRSADPMLSVVGVGRQAEALLSDLPRTCYGEGSLYHRLDEIGAKLCLVGLGLHYATYRHYIEELARVPFRFRKAFTGIVTVDGAARQEDWLYYAAPFLDNCQPDGVPLAALAEKAGLVRVAPVGRGEIRVIGCREYRTLALAQLAQNPWFTAQGPPVSRAEMMVGETEVADH